MIVPANSNSRPSASPAAPQVDETFLMMAAAQMHMEGRLVKEQGGVGMDPELQRQQQETEDILTKHDQVMTHKVIRDPNLGTIDRYLPGQEI